MPFTINGVGTRYCGKKNLQQRAGVCRSCGRQVNLASYDTRLWFVVVFIPVIPLGRKHIIDACPACRRHFVAEHEKWETAKQLETSGALEKFRSDPTPDNAIAAHQQLIGFHQMAEAGDLQRTMQEKFADNARVLTYLGTALFQLGQHEEAAALFQRALELRPDLPEGRIGLAEGRIRAGRTDEARQLLDFLEKPGAAQLYSLAPLERLARGYQQAGQHAQALDLFDKIIQALPQVAQNPGFRKVVKASEKSLGRPVTILPKARFNWRRLFSRPSAGTGGGPSFGVSRKQGLLVVAILAAVVIGCLAVANEYIRRHRTLYIVNGTTNLLQVEISGLGRVKVPPGVTPVLLSEGHYAARFDPPFRDDVTFDIRAAYFDRWSGKPAWILNPEGAALILCERHVYARNPTPGTFNCEYGRQFAVFPEVDYAFTPPPSQLQVASGEQQLTKFALQIYRGERLALVSTLMGKQRPGDAFQLAEWHLASHPEEQSMLSAYLRIGAGQRNVAHIISFLRDGLAKRPVHIEWHRTYENLLINTNRAGLAADYDRMLAAEPTNSALLYLRGRLGGSPAEEQDYFNRSLQADRDNPYPAYALAYDSAATGDWASAKRLLDHPIEQQPGNYEFLELWSSACLGLNLTGQLEAVWRRRLQANPADYVAENNLCQALILEHREAEAHTLVSDFRKAVARYGKDGQALADAADYDLAYMLGDFAGLEKMARRDSSPAGQRHLCFALIEQDRLEEAAQLLPMTNAEIDDPLELLALGLAWRVRGNSGEAVKWLDRASVLLRAAGDRARMADLLSGRLEPTAEVVDPILLAPAAKALLLANFAYASPNHRAELVAVARRLNVERGFPFHLVQRATAEER